MHYFCLTILKIMAFNDNPTVDDNSSKSEESVLKVKSVLTQKNGFICREESPDYGVDLDVELVENKESTSQKFAVQIKSSTSPKFINSKKGERFISFEFKTSRLGYLCGRPPAYGIIIMYDDSTKTIYFDYVEEIMKRITEIRPDDWKAQKSINIHIAPNVLDDESAKKLHKKMLAKHENHILLLMSHGENYGIASYSNTKSDKVDFDDKKQIIKFLEDYGAITFNEQRFNFIEQLLSKLTHTDIQNSDVLLFVAAITYGQLGNVIEADYYIEKFYRRKTPPTEHEIEVVEFSKMKIEFLKGEADFEKYLAKLEKLKTTSTSPMNKLNIEINYTYIKLIGFFKEEDSKADVEKVIDDLFNKIETSTLDKKDKNFLKILQSQNLNVFACKEFGNERLKLKLQVDLRTDTSNTKRRLSNVISLIQKSLKYALDVYNYSKTYGNIMLKAISMHSLARYYLNYQYQLMMLNIKTELQESPELKVVFENKINLALAAFELCASQNMHDEAHQTLICAYELKMVYMNQYKKELGLRSFYEIETILLEIERITGISHFKSVSRDSYEGLKAKLRYKDSLKNKTDKELEQIAMEILNAYELPIARLPNVIHEVKTFQIFEQRCTNKNIQLLQDKRHLSSQSTAYVEPSTFILQSKLSGLETKPSHDIEVLLNEFSTILHTA